MSESSRVIAVDALRGLTVAGMIIVNTPGTWAAIYAPLRHADWHGLTPTDLVFPFFLFIVGVSIALAYHRQLERPDRGAIYRRVAGRAAKLFAVGVFLSLWPEFAFSELRVTGVLQRIAIVFALATLVYLHVRWRGILVLTLAILVGYWALLTTVPVPRDAVIERALVTGKVDRAHGTADVSIRAAGPRTIAPNLEPATNLAGWIDRRYLPGRFYERTWDPEGWLSTFPALATALLGVLTGQFLLATASLRARLRGLAIGGVGCLALGYAWSAVFPLNKNMWTSSFVFVTAGGALVTLALLLWLTEYASARRALTPALAFGQNAITAYVAAAMLTFVFLRPWFGPSAATRLMNAITSLGLSAEFASLAFALAYTAVILLPMYVLYRRRIFVRL